MSEPSLTIGEIEIISPGNWVEHVELLEEAIREIDKTHPHLPQYENPDSIIDALCIAEGIVGTEWEDMP